jgi:hypothetical protein
MMGGILARPVEQYSEYEVLKYIFYKGSFFDKYKYFIPNFIITLLITIGIIFGYIFLEETNQTVLNRKKKLENNETEVEIFKPKSEPILSRIKGYLLETEILSSTTPLLTCIMYSGIKFL